MVKQQVILRPVFNRPEMLKLSIDYEIQARASNKLNTDFVTIFILEHGYTDEVEKIVESYPFKHVVIKRPFRYGLSANILEGFKVAFEFAEDWLIYIEDDVLIHKTYFEYVEQVLEVYRTGWSVISAYNFNDDGAVDQIRKDRHYAALAPVISKHFYMTYIKPCSNKDYYSNPAEFVCKLNNLYKDYQKDRTYRYKDSTHYMQAGLINRLCDVARIEEGLFVVMPFVNRQIHIGFWGHNRVKNKDLQGETFEERLNYLKEVITDPKLMYDMSGSKEYNDYKSFSSKLKKWKGKLVESEKNFIS